MPITSDKYRLQITVEAESPRDENILRLECPLAKPKPQSKDGNVHCASAKSSYPDRHVFQKMVLSDVFASAPSRTKLTLTSRSSQFKPGHRCLLQRNRQFRIVESSAKPKERRNRPFPDKSADAFGLLIVVARTTKSFSETVERKTSLFS